MFNPLCFILITTTIGWHYVSARHLVQPNYQRLQQPYYLPYSDYGYTYSGPPPYQPPFNQPYQQSYHSPMYSPPGTYFDQRRGILRPFPGGGVPVLVDYHKRCSNHYVGLKAHPDQNQYYYVCKPDCVIFGKCQNLQVFNNTSGQCIQHPPPEYVPTCTSVGRFPLFSDCHLYYKCEEDLQPKIYSCPAYMVFSPVSKKCISGNKCTPTQISPHSSYMPEYCANKFPPCYENGTFRSPSDCSLYYKCELQKHSVYLQTRLRCPTGQFYDLQKEECLPSTQVACDCIQVAELVYPKTNSIPYQPAVYPAQFDFDSLEENLYPVEHSQEEMDNNCGISEAKKDDIQVKEQVSTTLASETEETTLSNEFEEGNDSEAGILSDYVDMGEPKAQSEEIPDASTTTVSSEETTSIEGSGNTETDSQESTTTNNDEENTTLKEKDFTIENEEETTTDDSSEETTDEPEVLTEQIENETEKPLTEEPVKEETTTTSTTVVVTTNIPSSSAQPEPCENIIENDKGNNKPLPTDISDTHSQNVTTQIQSNTCLPKLTTTSLDSAQPMHTTLDTEFTRGSRSTLHEQNLTTVNTQTPTITTQLPTTKVTSITDNLEAIKTLEEFTLATERDNLGDDVETNLLDSETNLETAESTQSSEKTTPVSKETTQRPLDIDSKLKDSGNLLDTTQFLEHTTEVETSSAEDNVSEEKREDENTGNLLDTTQFSKHTTEVETSSTEDNISEEKKEDEESGNLLDTTQFSEHTTEVETSSAEDNVSEEKKEVEESGNLLDTTQFSEHTTEVEDEISEENSLDILEQETITTTTQPKDETKNELETKTSSINFEESSFKQISEETTPKTLVQTTTTEIPQTTTTEIPQTTTTEISQTTTLNPPTAESTHISGDLTMDDEFGLLDSEITIDDLESTTQIPEENLDFNTLEDEDLLPAKIKENNQETKSLNEKLVTLRAADFQDEELLPVHSKSTIMDELHEQTTDFNYITEDQEDTTDFDDDYTTITADNETTTPAGNEEHKQTFVTHHATVLKRRETLADEKIQATTTTTTTENPSETTTQTLTVLSSNENKDLDSYEDLLGVLDSEVILQSDEVSNNVITSAETRQTTIETSTVKQQFPHTHSTTITTTQTPTTTPKYITNTTPINSVINSTTSALFTPEPCKKQIDSIVLHVREKDQEHLAPSLADSSPSSKSLYYILKSKPVINNSNNSTNKVINSKNETVTAPPCLETENGHIPRLEIIAERPIDIHFSICPSTCDKDHKHNFAPTSSRAVFLRWFANKSKQTMGFETVNEVEQDDREKDC